MKVSIKLTNSQTFTVTVPDNSTVDNLKAVAIAASPASLNFTPSTTSLYLAGRKLNIKQLVSYYSIKEGSTVLLVLKSIPIPELIAKNQAQITKQTQAMNQNKSTSLSAETSTAPQTKVIKTVKRKSKSKRCSFNNCSSAPLRIVGDCDYCKGRFCSTHRLLENHFCSGLQSCKDQLHQRNATKLHSEQTIASKV
ncbi:Tmc1p [Ascoidea rubescens DSM 1968]|uniref:Putative an1-type zinc finger protein n=1 Tax=Ascoidea rubescens DSM 1968 TaxID=1344418 RepID=A0A1D2V881_9ASCO|nr:putative an1-type zinc finger protein [Ascoidea rubescens DSM 1968]ODV57866.1 putative an1-type zinc finger protein [Ascoidea rubescens DSM 1968]